MKKMYFLLLCFLLTGCKEKVETQINLKKTTLEYASNVKLYDLINIKNGKIITKNNLIDTNNIGKKRINIEYFNNQRNKEKFNFEINIKDTKNPIIIVPPEIVVNKEYDKPIEEKALCLDNHDKELECSIKGDYDINTNGEYNLKMYVKDSSGLENSQEFKLIVKENANDTIIKKPKCYISDLIANKKNENTQIGIDISFWQGNIDFNKVKESGVEFVIIRMGYGTDDEIVMDKKFKDNLKGAKDAGLQVGIYLYSYATNTKSAIKQAKWIIKNLDGEKLELPIAFDWEEFTKFNTYKLNIIELNRIGESFMNIIKKNGYTPILYGSKNYLESVWDLPEYNTWLANYIDITDYSKSYYIWQLSNTGRVNGINGDVDLNILYKKEMK